MEFTPAFWMILALTLVLGWVLGLMSRSGGGKWKRELKAERERHALALKERDLRIAEMERNRPVVVDRDHVRHDDHRTGIDNLDLTRGTDDGRSRTVIRPTRP